MDAKAHSEAIADFDDANLHLPGRSVHDGADEDFLDAVWSERSGEISEGDMERAELVPPLSPANLGRWSPSNQVLAIPNTRSLN